MKYIISLFWGFIFAFIAIFIITSILGDNGINKGLSLVNISILAIVFTVGAIIFDYVVNVDKNKIKGN